MMTPREQLRKMTALGEQGTLDEKHWYRLVNGMSAGGEDQNLDQPFHSHSVIYVDMYYEDVAIIFFSQTELSGLNCEFLCSHRAKAKTGTDNEEPDGHGAADPRPGPAEVPGGPSTV